MVDSTVDRGLEELGSTMRRFMEGFRDIHMRAERIVPNGNRCFVSVDWHGTGRATELPFHRRIFHVWTFSGDRAVRVEGFWDELEALRAAGMEPEREGPTD